MARQSNKDFSFKERIGYRSYLIKKQSPRAVFKDIDPEKNETNDRND